MKIATWNVNSIRARLPRLLDWLRQRQPDVACLQETKVVDDLFPRAEIESLGYHCVCTGQKTYNGVAVLSRTPPVEVLRDLPGEPPESERRFLAVDVSGVRVVCVYVPNGREAESPHWQAKLQWLERLRTYLAAALETTPELAVCGDFNIAPADADVWDVALWQGQNLFTEAEKAMFRGFLDLGLTDTLRHHQPGPGVYTWWDYRNGALHRGWGLRIDHILASPALAGRLLKAEVDREARKGSQPSDHAPVIAHFGATPAGEP